MTAPTPFALTVSGSAVIPLLAERAKIHVTVSNEGTHKATVSNEVITAAKQIEKLLRQVAPQDDSPEAKAASPLAHWSKTSLSATSFLPHMGSDDDREPERRYKSSIRFDIRFKEFKALGSFATTISSMARVEVGQIEWILTEETKTSYRSQLRKDAAKNAMSKAQDYCDVLGCGYLRPVELDDTEGSYSDHPVGYHRSMQTARKATRYVQSMQSPGSRSAQPYELQDDSDSPDLEFDPQEVQMSMDVTVKFHADPIQKSA